MATYSKRYHCFFESFEKDLQDTLAIIVSNSSLTPADKARIIGETVSGVISLSVEATHRQVADTMACAKNAAEINAINSRVAIDKIQSQKDLEVKTANIDKTYTEIRDIRGRLAIAKVQSRKDLELKTAQIEKIYSDIELNKQEIRLKKAQIELAYAQLAMAREELKLKIAQTKLAYAQIDLAYAQLDIEKEKLKLIPAQVLLTNAQAGLAKRQTSALDDAVRRDTAKIACESLGIIKSSGNNAGSWWNVASKTINNLSGQQLASQSTDPV